MTVRTPGPVGRLHELPPSAGVAGPLASGPNRVRIHDLPDGPGTRHASSQQPTSFTSRPTIIDLAWRSAYRIGFPLARVWWHWRRPSHEGALVAIHVGAALLLVRSSYRREWNLPGGGIRPGELPEAAAKRELEEELGLSVASLTEAGIFSGLVEGRPDRVHVFEVRLDRLPTLRLDGREIILAKLVALADVQHVALTAPVAAYVGGRLSMPAARGQRGDLR